MLGIIVMELFRRKFGGDTRDNNKIRQLYSNHHHVYSGWPGSRFRLLAVKSDQGRGSMHQRPEGWDPYRLGEVGVASWCGVYHVSDASQVDEDSSSTWLECCHSQRHKVSKQQKSLEPLAEDGQHSGWPKKVPNDKKIVLNRIKTCEWDKIYSST